MAEDRKIKIDKFDGHYFGFLKIQIEDYLYQKKLHEPLVKAKPAGMKAEDWTLLDRQALGVVKLSLAKKIAYNVVKEKTIYGLIKALSNMYEKPSMSKKMFFIRQLVNTKIKEGTSITDHVNVFNSILSRLVLVDIKFDDEVHALLLLSLLPESWEYIRRKTSGEYSNSLLSAEDKGRGRKQDRGLKQNRGRSKSKKRGQTKNRQDIMCWNCNQKGHFQNQCLKPLASKEKEVHMEVGDYDDGLRGSGYALVSWTLKDVRYIPGLKRILISVGQLDEKGPFVPLGFRIPEKEWQGKEVRKAKPDTLKTLKSTGEKIIVRVVLLRITTKVNCIPNLFFVIINYHPPDKSSYANITVKPSGKKVNVRTLFTPGGNGIDVAVLVDSISAISECFANTTYGFFLGKKVAYPVVANYVRNTWGKYRLVCLIFSSSTRLFSFQISSMDGLDVMLENGPWFIQNNPLILKKWHPDENLLKEDVNTVPIWVKLHGIPVTAFSKDCLSAIATKLGTPLMHESYTSDMCMQILGESRYTCNVHVEYEWKPPRCSSCKIFGHIHEECPKNTSAGEKKTVKKPSQTSRGILVGSKMGFKPHTEYRPVLKKSTASSSDNKKKGAEPTTEVSNSNPFDVLNSVDNDVEFVPMGGLLIW
ncbi:putative reverse transcriptase domain-containing protein [Tanacetum coccineum]